MASARVLFLPLVAAVFACGPDPIDIGAELGDGSDEMSDNDSSEGETGSDPTPDPGTEADLPFERGPSCEALEADYQALRSELRGCKDRHDCRLHFEADRCGCSYATNRDPAVEEVLLPLAAELDSLGCSAACDVACEPANFARCNESGLCEAIVAHK
jgi:hypothetical protein